MIFYGSICGHRTSRKDAKRCIKCRIKFLKTQIGIKNPVYKGGLPECKLCGKKLSLRGLEYCGKHSHLGKKRPEHSKRMMGRNNPRFGIVAYHSKYIKYKNIYFHSSWELAFVKWCNKNHIKWEYESKTFDLGNCTYTPDFYLPEFNLYIEIKGFWREDAKIKFKEFKQRYCGIRIKTIYKNELKEIGVIL